MKDRVEVKRELPERLELDEFCALQPRSYVYTRKNKRKQEKSFESVFRIFTVGVLIEYKLNLQKRNTYRHSCP